MKKLFRYLRYLWQTRNVIGIICPGNGKRCKAFLCNMGYGHNCYQLVRLYKLGLWWAKESPNGPRHTKMLRVLLLPDDLNKR